MAVYTYSNTDENRFWLLVMKENAQILFNRIMPGDEAQQANKFTIKFQDLYNKINQTELSRLNKDAFILTNEFRNFIITILYKQLVEGLFVGLKPNFVNDYISLTEKYLYLLGTFLNNEEPKYDALEQDIFWLPIFLSESRLISDSLGDFQLFLRERADRFTTEFNLFYNRSTIIKEERNRIGVEFPAEAGFRNSVRLNLNSFAEFVVELLMSVKGKMLPGTLTLIELTCIYRKLCYYTKQVAIIAKQPIPACDAGAVEIL